MCRVPPWPLVRDGATHDARARARVRLRCSFWCFWHVRTVALALRSLHSMTATWMACGSSSCRTARCVAPHTCERARTSMPAHVAWLLPPRYAYHHQVAAVCGHMVGVCYRRGCLAVLSRTRREATLAVRAAVAHVHRASTPHALAALHVVVAHVCVPQCQVTVCRLL